MALGWAPAEVNRLKMTLEGSNSGSPGRKRLSNG